ncbi:signal peptidase I [Nocardioides pelophilus]|uniref:signal peptidase I n=1 Tax=Nocardioides pelophilus TaxID=2172019 RepID=UPI001602D27F|nr:signal peptidase I [Nocardioides pelophilus]
MTLELAVAPDTGDSGAPSPAPAARAGAGRAWLALFVTILTRGYRAFLLTLLVAALLPTLWSWSSYVVRSGSMAPALAVGDVVVAQPFPSSDPVPVGRVMVFENPAPSAGNTLLVHRVVEYLGRGEYVTAGDANRDPDVTPVPSESFRARARILVPYVGLPLVWLRGGDYLLLGGWLLLTVAAFVRACFRGRTDEDRQSRKSKKHKGTVVGRATSVTALVGLVGLIGVALGAGIGNGIVPAGAAFTASTGSSANSWTVGQFVATYNETVLADDPYVFYLVDEASGPAALDAAPGHRTGTFASIAAYRQADALPNNPGYSVRLGSTTGRLVSGGSAVADPDRFSLELWFRTTTTAGGKLIGFESTRNASSLLYDRHVLMDPNGRLVYGGWTANTVRRITSPQAYNDGAWHHLVLTAVPRGNQQDSVMYVDGDLVTFGTTTRISAYNGWWRVGYGSLPIGPGYPATAGFAGSIDQVAVYPTALGPGRVAAHYDAR